MGFDNAFVSSRLVCSLKKRTCPCLAFFHLSSLGAHRKRLGTQSGFTLSIVDTPGLVEGGYVSYLVLDLIKRFLLNKTIDVLLYVDCLDAYRVDDLDKQIITAISDSFGKEIWRKGLLVLTHAQLCAPDDLNYDVFTARQSEAVLKAIRMGAGIRKRDTEDLSIPVSLVENSGRCNKNKNNEGFFQMVMPDPKLGKRDSWGCNKWEQRYCS